MRRTIFLCYDYADRDMADKLRKQLIPLEHKKLITMRGYGDIQPGDEWAKQMDEYLEQAEIILLLISANFIASSYCFRVQMQEAIKRHERKDARIIPIILRNVIWDIEPLDKLQALPSDAKPISQWRNRDEGYNDVALGIERVIEQWNARSLPDPVPERRIMIAKFDQLIDIAKTQMKPTERAQPTASTLQQLSIFIPIDVTLADLIVGWRILSHLSQPDEQINIIRRRITCGELANFASQLTTDQGDLAQAIKTWDAWRGAFEKSDDPRQQAMAKTFAREVAELREADR